jgi:hypothetical protein
MGGVTATKIPRVRGLWLAGLVALSLLTFGIVPHSSAASPAHTPTAPVVQTAAHLDPVVITRVPSSHVALLKSTAPYGDLAIAAALLALAAWLLCVRRSRSRAPLSLRSGPRLSRAPPLTA